MRRHHEWLAQRIKPNFIDTMDNWPKTLTIEINNFEIYLCHYHLDKDNYFLPIDRHPTVDNLNLIYSGTDYGLICFGHHHIVHQFESASRVYFNPGALGCYNKPCARYGIIQITDAGINIETHEVPYDNTDFLRSYIELDVPEKEFILKVFMEGN